MSKQDRFQDRTPSAAAQGEGSMGEPPAPAPAPVAPVAPAPVAPAPEPLKTPLAWAIALGHYVEVNPHVPQHTSHCDWRHAAADFLHGWSTYAYHHQGSEAFTLTEADYLAAINAAVNNTSQPVAHAAAVAI